MESLLRTRAACQRMRRQTPRSINGNPTSIETVARRSSHLAFVSGVMHTMRTSCGMLNSPSPPLASRRERLPPGEADTGQRPHRIPRRATRRIRPSPVWEGGDTLVASAAPSQALGVRPGRQRLPLLAASNQPPAAFGLRKQKRNRGC